MISAYISYIYLEPHVGLLATCNISPSVTDLYDCDVIVMPPQKILSSVHDVSYNYCRTKRED